MESLSFTVMKILFTLSLAVVTLSGIAQPSIIKEYQTNKMPGLAKAWSVKELEKAVVALNGVAENHLPRLSDPVTKPYFNKIISAGNLSSLPADEERKKLSDKYTPLAQRFLKIYTEDAGQQQLYSTEIVELQNLLLHNAHYQFLAFDELCKKHPKLSKDQDNFGKRLRTAYLTSLSEIVENLTNTSVYKPRDLERLSEVFRKSVESDSKFLNRFAKTQLRVDLMRISNSKISGTEKRNIDDGMAILNRL